MTMRSSMDDWQLLQAYARERSEAAFAELVSRHIDWVHSVALRETADSSQADDVVQSVFVLLASKSRDLRPGTLVGGWLFRATRHVAAHARRAELRRRIREATATAMNDDSTSESQDLLWQQLAPYLEDAVASLSEHYRAAILLRYYEKMPLRKVAETLGVSEDAAKKRVNRGVENLRAFLDRRGIKLGEVALAAILVDRTVQAASATLFSKVVCGSMAASGATALPQLARETLHAWHAAKVKLAATWIATSVALVFLALTTARMVRDDTGSMSSRGTAAPIRSASSSITTEANTRPFQAADSPFAASSKTGAVTGLVLDQLGRPISGAAIWGGFTSRPFAQDVSDELGRFALAIFEAPHFVTVTADGFAADQAELDPAALPKSLVFRLSPSPVLRLRAVDESGQGIEDVRVFLARWWGRTATLGQYLPQRTDMNGRMEWLSPPKGELLFELVKSGYRVSRTNKLTALGEEHVIVMHSVVTVSGSITDADTGDFVRSFKLTSGHSQPWVPYDETPMWDSRSEQGTNGFYRIVIEEEQLPSIRIEADGYQTVESSILITNQQVEVIRDFQLKRLGASNFIRGVVLLPNGTPAAGVEVALCTAIAGVDLRGTTFVSGLRGNVSPSQQHGYRVNTDSEGRFAFEPKPGAHTVVAAAPAGIGKARCFDSSQQLEIRLKPWGRIEGFARVADGNLSTRKARWQPPGMLTSWMTLFYASETGVLDVNGRFVIENVLPGFGRVSIDQGAGVAPILSDVVDVPPGETAQVQVGGAGTSVRGRLVAPPGVEIRSWTNQVSFAQVKAQWADYGMPRDLTGNAAERWRLEFEDTEAGRKWFRDQYSYEFKVREDGSFHLPEVLPGKYILFVNVAQPALGSGPHAMARRSDDPQIASASFKFNVPARSAETAAPVVVDLGDIKLLNR